MVKKDAKKIDNSVEAPVKTPVKVEKEPKESVVKEVIADEVAAIANAGGANLSRRALRELQRVAKKSPLLEKIKPWQILTALGVLAVAIIVAVVLVILSVFGDYAKGDVKLVNLYSTVYTDLIVKGAVEPETNFAKGAEIMAKFEYILTEDVEQKRMKYDVVRMDDGEKSYRKGSLTITPTNEDANGMRFIQIIGATSAPFDPGKYEFRLIEHSASDDCIIANEGESEDAFLTRCETQVAKKSFTVYDAPAKEGSDEQGSGD